MTHDCKLTRFCGKLDKSCAVQSSSQFPATDSSTSSAGVGKLSSNFLTARKIDAVSSFGVASFGETWDSRFNSSVLQFVDGASSVVDLLANKSSRKDGLSLSRWPLRR